MYQVFWSRIDKSSNVGNVCESSVILQMELNVGSKERGKGFWKFNNQWLEAWPNADLNANLKSINID